MAMFLTEKVSANGRTARIQTGPTGYEGETNHINQRETARSKEEPGETPEGWGRRETTFLLKVQFEQKFCS